MMRSKLPLGLASLLAAATLLVGCAEAGTSTDAAGDSASGPIELKLWTHSAGNPEELKVYTQIIDDFNASQSQYKVVEESFPKGSYNDAIAAAAAGGGLPCLIDMDGPVMPNWAWAGYIQPVGLPESLTDSLLPTAVGVYKDEIYSVGYWDAALAVFARKSVLEENDIRIPTVEEPWTKDEFGQALETLKAAGYDRPLDIDAEAASSDPEWASYAYSPFLQSFGGDEIDRSTMLSAKDALNGPEALAFGAWFQDLFTKGYTSNNGTQGNQEFIDDKVALSYTGSWNALGSLEAIGDDLLILPPPDLGDGPKIGGGSWQFGITAECAGQRAEGAREYLEFSFQDEYVAAFSDGQIVIPATAGGEELSKHFGEDGDLRPFVEFSQTFAVARPETPAYPVLSSVFDKAVKDIMNGADVKSTLDGAVKDIDANISSNSGYGF
ncbi:MAG: extracellular solute-binding protein [Propionibacteriaceae bacterium]|jgi:multiple sugar transport system substrate-binding protein|nr:extracellular solute-binding protein [Propionibacteriaceae bacterium]